MITLEEYKNLLEKLSSNTEIDYLISVFYEDCVEGCDLIGEFYSFYQIVYNKKGPYRFHDFAEIASKYVENKPDYPYTYYLEYLVILELYEIGNYVDFMKHVPNFKKPNIQPDFSLSVLSLRMNILHYLGMHQEALDALEDAVSHPCLKESAPYSKSIFYMNGISVLVFEDKLEEAKRYLELVAENMSYMNSEDHDKFIAYEFTRLYFEILSNKGNKEALSKLSKEFYMFIMKNYLMSTYANQDSYTLLEILDILKDFYQPEDEYSIIKKTIQDTNALPRDRASYYNHLYTSNNPFYWKNIEMRDEHLRTIYELYESSYENSSALKAILQMQLMEEKLDIMESKYQYDSLTGCYNRNYLIGIEDDVISDGAVLYIDLDGLKKINDSYGHENGDMYLKIFAKILLKSFSDENYHVIRYGGDEFVVIAKGTNSVLHSDIDRVYEYAKQAKLKNIGLSSIGFSLGIYYVEHDVYLKKAVNCADNAMYDCKLARKITKTYRYKEYKEE